MKCWSFDEDAGAIRRVSFVKWGKKREKCERGVTDSVGMRGPVDSGTENDYLPNMDIWLHVVKRDAGAMNSISEIS